MVYIGNFQLNKGDSMILKEKSKIYYIEYLDHGRSPDTNEEIKKNPLTLWCSGYIVNEDDHDAEYYALISMGSRFRDIRPKMYNYILKKCITKKIVVQIIKNDEKFGDIE